MEGKISWVTFKVLSHLRAEEPSGPLCFLKASLCPTFLCKGFTFQSVPSLSPRIAQTGWYLFLQVPRWTSVHGARYIPGQAHGTNTSILAASSCVIDLPVLTARKKAAQQILLVNARQMGRRCTAHWWLVGRKGYSYWKAAFVGSLAALVTQSGRAGMIPSIPARGGGPGVKEQPPQKPRLRPAGTDRPASQPSAVRPCGLIGKGPESPAI